MELKLRPDSSGKADKESNISAEICRKKKNRSLPGKEKRKRLRVVRKKEGIVWKSPLSIQCELSTAMSTPKKKM